MTLLTAINNLMEDTVPSSRYILELIVEQYTYVETF